MKNSNLKKQDTRMPISCSVKTAGPQINNLTKKVKSGGGLAGIARSIDDVNRIF